MSGLQMRLVGYDVGGERRGIMPEPISFTWTPPLNDLPALSMIYPEDGAGSEHLAGILEVAVEKCDPVTGEWAEPPNARFHALKRSWDLQDKTRVRRIDGVGVGWLGRRVRVWDRAGQMDSDGKRSFLSATPGVILGTIITEGHNRGWAPYLTRSFLDLTDSDGKRWDKVLTIAYDPGLDLQTVLQNLVDQGVCDYRWNGRTLEVYNPDKALAPDRTSGDTPIWLHGRDATASPEESTLEDLVTFARVVGEDGKVWEVPNPSANPTFGRLEAYYTQGGVSDEGTAMLLAESVLRAGEDIRTQHTREFHTASDMPLPIIDYPVGAWVYCDTEDGRQRLRVVQVSLTWDKEGGASGHITLGTRLDDQLSRLTKRTKGIVGGSTADGGSGSRPNPAGDDKRIPVAPEGLVVTSAAYLDAVGNPQGMVSMLWTAVDHATNGTVLDRVDRYEVQGRHAVEGEAWRTLTSCQATKLNHSPLPVGELWEFRVRAVAEPNSRRSDWSNVVRVRIEEDATPPPPPSKPSLHAHLGTLKVTWDGKTKSGGRMPPDFARIDVWVDGKCKGAITGESAGENFLVLTDLEYHVEYEIHFTAWDTSGNESDPSASATGMVVPLVDTEEMQRAITEANITLGTLNRDLLDEGLTGELDGYTTRIDAATADARNATQTAQDAINQQAGIREEASAALAQSGTALTSASKAVADAAAAVSGIQGAVDVASAASTAAAQASTSASQALADALAAQRSADSAGSKATAASTAAVSAQTAADAARVRADALVAQAENKSYNPSFEDGLAGWSVSTQTTVVDSTSAFHGGRVARVVRSGTSDQNIIQVPEYKAPAAPGQSWRTAARVRVVGTLPTAGYVTIAVRRHYATGTTGDTGVANLQWDQLTNDWQLIEGVTVMPTNAVGVASRLITRSTLPEGTVVEWDCVELQDVTMAAQAKADAAAAQAAAVAAQTAAGSAKSTADAAITAANGKTTNLWGTTEPSGLGTAKGDVWWQRASASVSSPIIGQWEWTGPTTGWVKRTLADAMIANLDAGKISTGFLDAARIRAGSIAAQKLVLASGRSIVVNGDYSQTLATGWSTNGEIVEGAGYSGGNVYRLTANGTALSAYNYPNTVPCSGGQAFRVFVRCKSSVAITLASQAGAFLRWKSAAGTYTYGWAYMPASPAKTWVEYSTILIAPPDTVEMAVALTTRSNLASGTVDFDVIEVWPAATAELIVDGAIIADKIAAGAITTDKLLVASGNMIPNGNGNTGTLANFSTWALATTDLPPGVGIQAAFTSSITATKATDEFIPVDGTQEYVVSLWAKAAKANSVFYVELLLYDKDKAQIAGTGAINPRYPVSNVTMPTTWTRYETGMAFTNPDVAYVKIRVYHNHTNGSVVTTQTIAGLNMVPRMGAVMISDGAVTAGKIAAGAVVAGNLAAGAVTAGSIAAGAVTTTTLAADSVTGAKIAGGTITGDLVAASTIGVEKLLVGSMDNVVPDPQMTSTAQWTSASVGTGSGFDTAVVPDGATRSYKMAQKATSGSMSLYAPIPANRAPCEPGDAFTCYTQVYVDGALPAGLSSIQMRVYYYDAAGSNIGNYAGGTLLPADVTTKKWIRVGGAPQVAPEGAVSMTPRLTVYITANTVPNSTTFRVAMISAFRAATGELIVDGSITTDHLTAGAITTAKIAAGAITANQLATNSVTSAKILAGSVGTNELAANAVTADKITALAITAAKIAALAITADKIAVNAVTTDKVAAGAITAVELAADSVIASKIAANAVTTAKIAANAVTANELAANSVTAVAIKAGTITGDELSATAIDGKTITGATIQTDTNAYGSGAGIRLADKGTSATLRAWNGANYVSINPNLSGTSQPGIMFVRGTTAIYSLYASTANRFTAWDTVNDTDVLSASTTVFMARGANTARTMSANLGIYGSQIWTAGSRRDLKIMIEDAPADWATKALQLRPRTWYDKGAYDAFADYLTTTDPDAEPGNDIGMVGTRIPGFVAEEVEEIGLRVFCTYDEDGRLQGLAYDRITAALVSLAKRQQSQIERLESQVAALQEAA